MLSGLHEMLGCDWNISVHYIFTTGRTHCTTLRYGLTVTRDMNSRVPRFCPQPPSLTMIKGAVAKWTNSRKDFGLTVQIQDDRNSRIFCNKISEIETNLSAFCPTQEYAVHVRCKSQSIARVCATCDIVGSRCLKIDESLLRQPQIKLLDAFCA
jgi:hypothetical protein